MLNLLHRVDEKRDRPCSLPRTPGLGQKRQQDRYNQVTFILLLFNIHLFGTNPHWLNWNFVFFRSHCPFRDTFEIHHMGWNLTTCKNECNLHPLKHNTAFKHFVISYASLCCLGNTSPQNQDSATYNLERLSFYALTFISEFDISLSSLKETLKKNTRNSKQAKSEPKCYS